MPQLEPSDITKTVTNQATNSPSDLFVRSHQTDDNRSVLESGVHWVASHLGVSESPLSSTVEKDVAEFATTVPLFMGGARSYFISGALYALNQAKQSDSSSNQLKDAGFGLAKGLATKATFEWLGAKTNLNFAAKGVAMGATSRALDLGLTRETYQGKDGRPDLLGGLAMVGTASLNPRSLVTDVAVFGVAHGTFKWADKLLDGKLGKAPVLASTFTGSTFGLTSGALGEVQRERQSKEGINPGQILLKAGEQALITGAAAATGAKLTEYASRPQVVKTANAEPIKAESSSSLASNRSDTFATGLKSLKTALAEKLSDASLVVRGKTFGLAYGSGDVAAPNGELSSSNSSEEHHEANLQPPPHYREGPATWQNDAHDVPINVIGYWGEKDGRHFVKIDDSLGGIPLDQVLYPEAHGDETGLHVPKIEPSPTIAAPVEAPATPKTFEIDQKRVPEGREDDFKQGSELLVKALRSDAEYQDIVAFYKWTRDGGAGLEEPMFALSDSYAAKRTTAERAALTRDIVRDAYEPNIEFPNYSEHTELANRGARLVSNLAVDDPKAEDIFAFQNFVLEPQSEHVAEGLKNFADWLSERTGNPALADRVHRSFALPSELNFNLTGPEHEALLKGKGLMEKLIASGGTDAGVVAQLREFARGEGRDIEPQVLHVASILGGQTGYDFMRDDIYHHGEAPYWVKDQNGDYGNSFVWTKPEDKPRVDNMLGTAYGAIDSQDPKLASILFDDLNFKLKFSTPELRKTILEYAERSNNEALLALVRDALTADRPQVTAGMTRNDQVRFEPFRQLVMGRPEPPAQSVEDNKAAGLEDNKAKGVERYKNEVRGWLFDNGDLIPQIMELAPGMKSSLALGVIDETLGTNFLASRQAEINDLVGRRQIFYPDSTQASETFQRPSGVPGGKVFEMPVDDLITTLYNSDDSVQKLRAGNAAFRRINEMNSDQFVQYLSWLYDSSPVSDGKGGQIHRWNMDAISLPGASFFHRSDVVNNLFHAPEGQRLFSVDSLRQYLSIPQTGAPAFNEVLQQHGDLLPNWMLSDINKRWLLQPQRGETPLASYIPADIQERVRQDAEQQFARDQQAEAEGRSRGRKPRPPEALPAESQLERLNNLGKLLDSGMPQEAIDKLMQLGGQDGRVLRDVLTKIQNYQGNETFRRAIELTLPNANDIYMFNAFVRAMEDSCNARNSDQAASSGQFAKILAETMVAPGSQAEADLVTGGTGEDGKGISILDAMATRQVRLPRVEKFRGKPGEPRREPPPPTPVDWDFRSPEQIDADKEAQLAANRAAEPSTAEPRAAEPSTAEPRAAEPSTAEPRAAEPRAAAPSAAAPSAAAPSTAELNAVNAPADMTARQPDETASTGHEHSDEHAFSEELLRALEEHLNPEEGETDEYGEVPGHVHLDEHEVHPTHEGDTALEHHDTDPSVDLATQLVKNKLISESDMEAAIGIAKSMNRTLPETLIDLGAISKEDLEKAINSLEDPAAITSPAELDATANLEPNAVTQTPAPGAAPARAQEPVQLDTTAGSAETLPFMPTAPGTPEQVLSKRSASPEVQVGASTTEGIDAGTNENLADLGKEEEPKPVEIQLTQTEANILEALETRGTLHTSDLSKAVASSGITQRQLRIYLETLRGKHLIQQVPGKDAWELTQ